MLAGTGSRARASHDGSVAAVTTDERCGASWGKGNSPHRNRRVER